MAPRSPRQDESVAILDRQLHVQFANSSSSLEDVLSALAKYRTACEHKLEERDLEAESRRTIEERLWNYHLKVNGRFRVTLRQLKKEGNKKAVEFRKLGKDYEKFIKSSQGSYRSQIRSLALNNGGIPEMERVALLISPSSSFKSLHPSTDPLLRKQVLSSCYQNLIYLGDLSRYREQELSSKAPDWRPARGYYDLANSIYPFSGTSHNQLAVIAQHDGDHFRATYHLYRALTVEEPFPNSKQNLEIEFRRIISAHRKTQPSEISVSSDAAYSTLRSKFVLLHAVYWSNDASVDQDALESEIIDLMSAELEKEMPTPLFLKMVLTSLAAEYMAQESLQADTDTAQTLQRWLYLLRINIRTFNLLLRKLEVDLIGSQNQHTARTILLPCVRLYSSWLLCYSKIISGASSNPLLGNHTTELWAGYASCLSLIAQKYSFENFTSVRYMLPEDVDTFGFKPLQSRLTEDVWYQDEQIPKPRWTEVKESDRNFATEMMFRIRSTLLSGLQLVCEEGTTPLTLADGAFLYQITDVPSHSQQLSNTATTTELAAPFLYQPPAIQDTSSLAEDQTVAQDVEASRMVDELVGTLNGEPLHSSISVDTLPERNDPPTPPEQDAPSPSGFVNASSFPVGSHTAQDVANIIQRPSKSQLPSPSMPQSSIRKSLGSPSTPAFTPRSRASPATALQQSARNSQQASPSVSVADTSHFRSHSSESVQSQTTRQPRGSDNLWTSFQQPYVSPAYPTSTVPSPGLPSPTARVYDVDAFDHSLLQSIEPDRYGMGSLLFGSSNSAWAPTGQERKRLSTEGSRISQTQSPIGSKPTVRPDI